MVCFDTDFLVACLQKDMHAIKELQQLQADGENESVATTIIDAELWKGAYRSTDKELSKVKGFLDSLEMITPDFESAKISGQLAASLRSKAIGELDILIASIAIAKNQVLVTKNKRHVERVPGLQLQSW